MELEKVSPATVYERWEEFYVSSDKGKREVHYYLKRKDGSGSDLAVIGKEKTLRHMSYKFAFKEGSLLSIFANSSSFLAKLRSRREVVDWLNSVIDSGTFAKVYYIYVFLFDGDWELECHVPSRIISFCLLGFFPAAVLEIL